MIMKKAMIWTVILLATSSQVMAGGGAGPGIPGPIPTGSQVYYFTNNTTGAQSSQVLEVNWGDANVQSLFNGAQQAGYSAANAAAAQGATVEAQFNAYLGAVNSYIYNNVPLPASPQAYASQFFPTSPSQPVTSSVMDLGTGLTTAPSKGGVACMEMSVVESEVINSAAGDFGIVSSSPVQSTITLTLNGVTTTAPHASVSTETSFDTDVTISNPSIPSVAPMSGDSWNTYAQVKNNGSINNVDVSAPPGESGAQIATDLTNSPDAVNDLVSAAANPSAAPNVIANDGTAPAFNFVENASAETGSEVTVANAAGDASGLAGSAGLMSMTMTSLSMGAMSYQVASSFWETNNASTQQIQVANLSYCASSSNCTNNLNSSEGGNNIVAVADMMFQNSVAPNPTTGGILSASNNYLSAAGQAVDGLYNLAMGNIAQAQNNSNLVTTYQNAAVSDLQNVGSGIWQSAQAGAYAVYALGQAASGNPSTLASIAAPIIQNAGASINALENTALNNISEIINPGTTTPPNIGITTGVQGSTQVLNTAGGVSTAFADGSYIVQNTSGQTVASGVPALGSLAQSTVQVSGTGGYTGSVTLYEQYQSGQTPVLMTSTGQQVTNLTIGSDGGVEYLTNGVTQTINVSGAGTEVPLLPSTTTSDTIPPDPGDDGDG